MNAIIKGAIPFSEARVLVAIVRLTEGFKHYRAVNLSYSDLAEATGMDTGAAKRAIKRLLEKRFISRSKQGKSRTSKTRYVVNYDSGDWKIDPIESVAIRTENYKGCEARTEDENDPRIDNTGDHFDPSTMDHCVPSTMDHFDPRTGDHFVPSYDERTQANTGAAAEDRKYDRKEDRKEKEKDTSCLKQTDSSFIFLASSEDISARGSISRDECVWQADQILSRIWRRALSEKHREAIEMLFPSDLSYENSNGKVLLRIVHDGIGETADLNERLNSDGLNRVKDPIQRSIDNAADALSVSLQRFRRKGRGYPPSSSLQHDPDAATKTRYFYYTGEEDSDDE